VTFFPKVNPVFFSKIGGALAHALGKVTSMSKSKVLVVMSSANALDLKDGKNLLDRLLPERVRRALPQAPRGRL